MSRSIISLLLVLTLSLLAGHSFTEAKKSEKDHSFRQTISVLTLGDLPDLDKEDSNTLADAPFQGASSKFELEKAEPTKAEMESFTEFLKATNGKPASHLDLDSFSASEFSASGETNECDTNPCPEFNTCEESATSPFYTCSSPCDASPCQNGGSCAATSTTTYHCTCATGWTDDTCSTNIDDCATQPCLNGATCVDGIASFTCTCATGYGGFLCQDYVAQCNIAPCLNGGTCTNATDGYVCTCAKGWIGDNCNIANNATRPSNSVRIQQILAIVLTPDEYPAFKASYGAALALALGIDQSWIVWLYIGAPQTTSQSADFSLQATTTEVDYDIVIPSTSTFTPTSLYTSLQAAFADPNSTIRQSTYGSLVSGTYQTCPDGTVATTCTTTLSSTGTVITGNPTTPTSNNSTWIALGCAAAVFFAIVTGGICYCNKKKPQRVGQTLTTGDGSLQAAWDDVHGGANGGSGATFVQIGGETEMGTRAEGAHFIPATQQS